MNETTPTSKKRSAFFIPEVGVWILIWIVLTVYSFASFFNTNIPEGSNNIEIISVYAFYLLLPLVLVIKGIKMITMKKSRRAILYLCLCVLFIILFWTPWENLL
ncbi:hypothetical protein HUG20_18515 [Salicibibacter cibi]|uniref:Uncharacterized protein n=1 Tax=Salicibibacter cibi TaxID=2743001 RepID=A0A7T7CGZ4_9BACI|nr:hypothetical protein [Salicibibacter cibi]QQK81710.1 hypothetical protein HUG20_18515 [Salicibibacter cibi]